jgi:hypothetical protein
LAGVPFAVFLALGAPFVLLASFLEAGLLGASAAAAAALSLVSVFVMRIVLFCTGFAHDDSSLQFGETASQIFSDYRRKYLNEDQANRAGQLPF